MSRLDRCLVYIAAALLPVAVGVFVWAMAKTIEAYAPKLECTARLHGSDK